MAASTAGSGLRAADAPGRHKAYLCDACLDADWGTVLCQAEDMDLNSCAPYPPGFPLAGPGVLGGCGAAATAAPGLAVPLHSVGGAFHPYAGGGAGLLGFGEGLPAEQLWPADAGWGQAKQPKKGAATSSKASQQRYRERKKARFTEMEETIAQLQKRLQELQSLQRRNHVLEGKNSDMEARLVEREREIEDLKFMLGRKNLRSEEAQQQAVGEPASSDAAAAAAAAARSSGSGSAAAPAGDSAAGPAGTAGTAADRAAPRCARCGGVCCTPLGVDLVELDFDGHWQRRCGQLRALVERCSLGDASPDGEGVAPEVMKELCALVGLCCQLRHSAMSAEGAKALALFAGGRKWIGALERGAEAGSSSRSRWERVIQALKLKKGQRQQLLALREEHLAKLRAIYQERQNLNLQAMALMLPRKSPLARLDTTIEGTLARMGMRGYLATARPNMELGGLLDGVRDTVRREQRAVIDFNSLAISKIFTPVQAAIYITVSFPELGDILALANSLARRVGQDTPGGGQGVCGGQCGGACSGACGLAREAKTSCACRADSSGGSGTGCSERCDSGSCCLLCPKQ